MYTHSKIQKQNAKNMRNNPTETENILWQYLRKSQLNDLKFRRQQPIGKYIVDFLCCSEKIIIELDGGQHNTEDNKKYDIERDNFLKKEGYKVIRIWNNDVLNNIDGVIEYLAQNTHPLTPSPNGRGNKPIPSLEGRVEISDFVVGEKFPKLKIQCPAKINLTLKVVGKRPDGFHNIESIMQTIDLYDYLTIEVKQSENFEIILSGNNPEIPYNEKNLVYKAAKLFFDTISDKNESLRLQRHSEHSALSEYPALYGSPSRHSERSEESHFAVHLQCRQESVQNLPQNDKNYKISIYIDKNIPVAAGLAGGSTDAAGTLYGLNEIFNRPLDKKQLHELCAQLGSDLNVCLEGGRLMTKGRGEIIEPMGFEEFNLALIKPKNLGISAKQAYTKFSEKNTHPLTPSPQGRGNNKIPSQNGRENKEIPSLNGRRNNTIPIPNGGQSDGRGNNQTPSLEGRVEISDFGVGEKNSTPYREGRGKGVGDRSSFLNDLEWAIIDDYKELQKIKELYPNSMMSGSGSTYFEIDGKFEPLEGYEIFNNHKAVNFGIKKVPLD